ncbi:hypothetical protein IJ768_02575 [Candidatus Saccharibacteria bacterium]|nr:hypothetical protein [Candidatus Saccharibacteria bacterium]
MEIVSKILKFILSLVFITPVKCVRDLIDTIKNLKSKAIKDHSWDVFSLIMELAVIIPVVYAIIVIVLEYVTKSQNGVWDSPNPLRAVNPPVGMVCFYGVLVMLISVGVEFFRRKTEVGNAKKAFAVEKDRIIDLVKKSAWLMIVLTLTTWIALIGSLIAQLIIWGLIIYFVFGGFFINSETTGGKTKKATSSDRAYHGSSRVFSEKEIVAIMEKSPKLNMNKYDWEDLARALDESTYIKDIKVIMAGKLPIYIFPRDKKPRINLHLLKESAVESGGGLFEKAKEHFTVNELKNGNICVIHDGKRLTSKDM